MRKENYIRPTLSIVRFQPPLLYDASADNKDGEGWGGDYAKKHYYLPDEEEEEEDYYRIN